MGAGGLQGHLGGVFGQEDLDEEIRKASLPRLPRQLLRRRHESKT